MLMTGLLSLSIHEALTFDGIEIALHPDLFNESLRNGSVGRPLISSNTSVASLATVPTGTFQNTLHFRTSSDTFAVPPNDSDSKGFSLEDGRASMTPTAMPTSVSNRRLEVGDMIEIRVWDPIESGAKLPESSLSVMARRSPPRNTNTLTDSSRRSPVSSSTTNEIPRTTAIPNAAVEATSSMLHPRLSSSSSLQYSTDSTASPPDSKGYDPHTEPSVLELVKGTIEPTTLPASPKFDGHKTVAAHDKGIFNSGTGIPPPFPRGRLNSAEAPPRGASKPIVLPKSRTPSSTPNTDSSDSRKRPPVSPMPPPPKSTIAGHFRDVSDMTVDSENVVLTHDLSAPSMDSCDEATEDNDALAKISSTHNLRLSFIMLVTEKTLTSLKGSGRTQVSMLRQVADLYSLSPYDMVTVNKIEPSDEASVLAAVSADFVTVTIKDQFISRADMHFFQRSLTGRWIYEGERLSNATKGVSAHAREIRHANRLAKSGIVTDDTMITFRSRSARIVWLVQISSEMWDYASPYEQEREINGSDVDESSCDLYFDKFLKFMYRLFEKWEELEVTHSLTVVFFSRTFLSSQNLPGDTNGGINSHGNVDVYGRKYEDHFRTVIENEISADWESIVVRIKREFVRYPFEVGWNLSSEGGRRPSTAIQGNILEAVNVTLNLMQFHYFDRDLHRTGNSIVIVSPGCGVFEVDKGLAGITYQRMMDNGIGSDMLSLGLPPLHTAPFFHYNNDVASIEAHGVDADKTYHEIPHWMHLSFVSYDDDDFFGDLTNKSASGTPSRHSVYGVEVAANGFLIPCRKDDSESARMGQDHPSSTSFSALANVAASPYVSRSKTRQRQLISGRDFQDILEACRPRNAGYSLPSALSSLLRMHEYMKEAEPAEPAAHLETKKSTERTVHAMARPGEPLTQDTPTLPSSERLREWGAVDFDEVGRRENSNSLNSAPEIRDRSESSDQSSTPSSFASQVSYLMGRSIERGRSMFNQRLALPGSTSGIIRIQRSPSLEFEAMNAPLNGNKIEDSLFALDGNDNVSTRKQTRTDDLTGSGNDVTSEHTKGTATADDLRRRMLERDRHFFECGKAAKLASTVSALPIAPLPHSGGTTPSSTMPPSSTTVTSQGTGGLAAALSQYQGSNSDVQVQTEAVNVRKIRSTGRLYDIGTGAGAFSKPQSFRHHLGIVGTSDPSESAMTYKKNCQGFLGEIDIGNQPISTDKEKKASDVSTSKSSPTNTHLRKKKTHQHVSSRTLGHSRALSPPKETIPSPPKSHDSRRRKRALNPFKQQDEEEVLAEKSHNRRRWSHVFPLGEVEFKRHAGPNWKSLCQPAILPLTIDYFPKPQELEGETATYQFSHWRILLGGMARPHYTHHSELLMEMIRQRLTQDFQLVPRSVVVKSGRKRGSDEHALSMGHVIHVLTSGYDRSSNEPSIEVVQYTARRAQRNEFKYRYLLYSPSTKKYSKVVQTFNKFSDSYLWNKVDNIIGDGDKKFLEGMRFRRLMFALIPDRFVDVSEENTYIEKFQRLLEYLNKLRENDQGDEDINIKITSGDETKIDPRRTRRGTAEIDLMKRFTVHLRKGKRDPYEWIEIAMESRFDTKRSYRIMFHWLAASTGKVEAQVQLLHRRCTQYGLKLISFPQTSISKNIFLNPFTAPTILCIRDRERANRLEAAVLEMDFVNDGIHMTDQDFLDCIENKDEYRLKRVGSIPAQQFVHRSGTLFIRLIRDEQGWAIVALIENKRLTTGDDELLKIARSSFRSLTDFL